MVVTHLTPPPSVDVAEQDDPDLKRRSTFRASRSHASHSRLTTRTTLVSLRKPVI